ncbi:unnamed protein product [Fraxinus pennsylvanica]|uniref:Uncharacterized protein n=1 Tax=Fraxinus pennsylvanica TaxID=56036 RepID=A0AAD2A9W6_9LAMI|nr:unnamed protein product [Fraxinus pennsylvanica]
MFFPWCLTLSLTVLICSVNLGYAATLVTDEVEALKQIAKTLGKKNWNFNVDPCRHDEPSWFTHTEDIRVNQVNQVECDCSFYNNTTCHVARIILKRQSLGGKVPPELFRLPYLIEIDLTRNYLNGTIPREWGTMQRLARISLLGNRVTGGLPIELANISTLLNLTLDYNQLSGNIPPQFGDFSSLEKLSLISNNLTGELPQSLAKLTTMKDFRISDNNFSGNIPNFIESWTSLRRLEIQGSGLSGPIPYGIASMANLSQLRISDLKGNESTFPLLRNNSNFKNM